MNCRFSFCAAALALGWLAVCPGLRGADVPAVDRILRQDNKILVVANGATSEIAKETAMANNVVVSTNGTFKVDGGKERVLLEGQIISRDGTLTSPDGSVVPVMNHVIMQRGRVMAVKDGESTALTTPFTFPDGSGVTADGLFTGTDGRQVRLLDGQVFKMSGAALPAKDTVMLRAGKVMVQKDGSLLPVRPGSSLMMNDGTKVMGDGVVITPDGQRKTLAEGEILVIQGVITRRP